MQITDLNTDGKPMFCAYMSLEEVAALKEACYMAKIVLTDNWNKNAEEWQTRLTTLQQTLQKALWDTSFTPEQKARY